MDVNKYILRKIEANKDLHLQLRTSHINDTGTSTFVLCYDKHRFYSVLLSTAGLPDDASEKKNIIDERFCNVVAALAEYAKNNGVA